VGINVNFGLMSFGTVAAFKKKCGMKIAGFRLVSAANRLGPMICRDSFAELSGLLPNVSEATAGDMTFSAAQMDPDRIRMGEATKNVSVIGVGGICYLLGLLLTYRWILDCAQPCLHNLIDFTTHGRMPENRTVKQAQSCLRAASGNLDEQDHQNREQPGVLTRSFDQAAALLRRWHVISDPSARSAQAQTADARRSHGPEEGSNTALWALVNFISCGRAKRRLSSRTFDNPCAAPSNAREPSGSLSGLLAGGQPSSLRTRSGTSLLESQQNEQTRESAKSIWARSWQP
ncbi:unnamed protein product, partial [Polarella glacialis]